MFSKNALLVGASKKGILFTFSKYTAEILRFSVI